VARSAGACCIGGVRIDKRGEYQERAGGRVGARKLPKPRKLRKLRSLLGFRDISRQTLAMEQRFSAGYPVDSFWFGRAIPWCRSPCRLASPSLNQIDISCAQQPRRLVRQYLLDRRGRAACFTARKMTSPDELDERRDSSDR